MDGFISFEKASSSQAQQLTSLVPRVEQQLQELRGKGVLSGPLTIMGIGASHAAALPALWTLASRGIDAQVLDPGETPLPLAIGNRSLVAVSQSGRSSEMIKATQTVSSEKRFGVINCVPSPLSGMVDSLISLGNIEDSYASTVGYTATVVALAMLAEAWNDGSVSAHWQQVGSLVEQTRESVEKVIDRVAPVIVESHGADFVAAGASLGSAEAGALLLREVARIPSSSMNTRRYLHGAMESAGTFAHVILGGAREKKLGAKLGGVGLPVVLIGSDSEDVSNVHSVPIPETSPALRSVLEGVALQELSRVAAELRGVEIEDFVFENEDTKQSEGA